MDFFENYKKQIISLISLILIITAFTTLGKNSNIPFIENAVNLILTPVQKITTEVSGWISDKTQSITSKTDYEKENKELKEKIETLEAENKRLALFEERNTELSSLLDISQKYAAFDTTGALIIGKDPGNWYNIFTIDKGTKDGMKNNMVITSSKGLVGKITSADSLSSKSQSILDSRSSVPAMSLRTGDLGVVKGDYTLMSNGLCLMEYIDTDAQIIEGDEIVTSHLSNIYPAGIPIGSVKEINVDPNGLTKYAVIQPHVDFKHLDTVLIIDGDSMEATEPDTEETPPTEDLPKEEE